MLILFLLLSEFSSAQVKRSVSLGTAFTSGNLASINTLFQAAFSKDSGRYCWTMNPLFQFTAIKQGAKYSQYERESFFTASISRKTGKWKLIGFTDAENSFLRRTLFRISGGIGYGYSFIDNESWKVSVSEVVMPELYLPDSIASGRTLSLRLSTRFKVKYSGKVNFESVSFFQPAVWSSQHVALSENINFRSINSLDIPVTAKISIGVQALLQVFTLPHYLDNSIRKSDTRVSMVFKSEF